jgi:hypothetical protein
MSIDAAFQNQSNTFSVVTSGTTLTSLSQTVSFASPINSQPAAQATGLASPAPPNFRIVAPSTNANPVFVSITNAARTAAVPGTNPSLEFPILPGEDKLFSLTNFPQPPNFTLLINTISVGTSQQLYVTFGEGR